MNKQNLFLSLAVLGAVLPWVGFGRFFMVEGLSGNFLGALFVNGASAGFTIDLLISSLVFWIFLYGEASRDRIRRPWLFIVVNLLIGLSCALPLALWHRERADLLVPGRVTGA